MLDLDLQHRLGLRRGQQHRWVAHHRKGPARPSSGRQAGGHLEASRSPHRRLRRRPEEPASRTSRSRRKGAEVDRGSTVVRRRLAPATAGLHVLSAHRRGDVDNVRYVRLVIPCSRTTATGSSWTSLALTVRVRSRTVCPYRRPVRRRPVRRRRSGGAGQAPVALAQGRPEPVGTERGLRDVRRGTALGGPRRVLLLLVGREQEHDDRARALGEDLARRVEAVDARAGSRP